MKESLKHLEERNKEAAAAHALYTTFLKEFDEAKTEDEKVHVHV